MGGCILSEIFGYYDVLRELQSIQPVQVEGQGNFSTLYYKERFLQRVLGAFEFEDWPDTINPDFVLPVLFLGGYIGGCDPGGGPVMLPCGFRERDYQYQPRILIFKNPVLGSFEKEIGKDCVLIRLVPSCIGLDGMIRRYAEMCASADASLNVNLINSRTAYFAQAEDKAEAQGLKKVLDDLSRGVPAVFWRKKKGLENPEMPFQHVPVKDSFIAKELVEVRRMILEDFDREIGFSMMSKKERVLTAEVEENSAEIHNNIQAMLDSLTRGIDDFNSMFGTSIKVSYRYDYLREVSEDESNPVQPVEGGGRGAAGPVRGTEGKSSAQS